MARARSSLMCASWVLSDVVGSMGFSFLKAQG